MFMLDQRLSLEVPGEKFKLMLHSSRINLVLDLLGTLARIRLPIWVTEIAFLISLI